MARNNYKDESWIGKKFNEVTIIGISENRTSDGKVKWYCRCSCGTEWWTDAYSVKKGYTKHCKTHKRGSIYEDVSFIGKTFNEIEVLDILPRKSGEEVKWLCKCSCGREWPVDAYRVKNCNIKNCGECKTYKLSLPSLIGTKINGIEILSIFDTPDGLKYSCKCYCGTIFDEFAHSIHSGHKKSCGCLRNDYKDEKWLNKVLESGVTIISIIPVKNKHTLWKCRCFCGKEFISEAYKIRSLVKNNCGCTRNNCTNKSWEGVTLDNGIKVLEVLEEKSSSGETLWSCQCHCGKIWPVRALAVLHGNTNSCGCSHGNDYSDRNEWIGKVIESNGIEVLDIIGIIDKHVYWKCKCHCGNEFDAPASHVFRGEVNSCGCNRKNYLDKQWEGTLLSTGVKVLKILDERDKKGNVQWLCQCHCGETFKNSGSCIVKGNKRGGVSSCGCLTKSFGVYKIESMLKDNNIKFSCEYSFEDLISDKASKLRYDFAILNDSNNVITLIEYDGEQHYNLKSYLSLSRGNKTEEDFNKLLMRDKQKDDYAREHNIPLYRIPYTYTPEQIEARVLEILKGLNWE